VLANEFSSKYSSKREVYQFLAGQVRAYLAGYDCVSIYFLRSIAIGEKKCKLSLVLTFHAVVIKSDDIKHLFVPFYTGLSINQMMVEAAKYPRVADYMPDGADLLRMPRQWLINVAFTVCGEGFERWINQQVQNRNTKVADNNKLMIHLDPEIHRAYMESTQVSSK
jgi:hypothetical protein